MKIGTFMKKDIIYARDWAKIPEKTWSGTAWNLRQNLMTYYNIIDIKLKAHCLRDYFAKVKLCKRDCSLTNIKNNRKRFLNKVKKINAPVFQFDETFSIKDSYLYIDLCVDYLVKLKSIDESTFNYSGFQKIPLVNLEKRAIEQNEYMTNYCRHIFTMGKWLKEYIVKEMNIPESKVTAVGGGINIDQSKIDYSEKEGNKILFVGRDFKRKGGELVIEAFKELKKEILNAELYIVGPSSKPYINDIPGVFFLGDIESKDLYKYFNKCDVFCMPSYFEAYGLVFAEALCFGLPCIGRNAFEMKYFIQENENGYLLHNDDKNELCDLMKKAIFNSNMKEFLKNNKENYLKEFSWEEVARRCSYII